MCHAKVWENVRRASSRMICEKIRRRGMIGGRRARVCRDGRATTAGTAPSVQDNARHQCRSPHKISIPVYRNIARNSVLGSGMLPVGNPLPCLPVSGQQRDVSARQEFEQCTPFVACIDGIINCFAGSYGHFAMHETLVDGSRPNLGLDQAGFAAVTTCVAQTPRISIQLFTAL